METDSNARPSLLYDEDGLYRQALVLHQVFNSAGLSRGMSAMLDRMQAEKAVKTTGSYRTGFRQTA